MWDKKELLRKLKYLKELSKNINDEEKRYEVAQNQSSILEMLELLDNKRITIYNSPLLLSTTKYALKKACKKTSNYQIIWSKDLKKDIEFSFYLCKNLALQPLLAEDESQKVYVSLPKKDYIESASEQVKVEEETSWFQNIINSIIDFIQ